MKLEQEMQTKQRLRESRELAQRILREIAPRSVELLGGSEPLRQQLAGGKVPLVAQQGELLVIEEPE